MDEEIKHPTTGDPARCAAPAGSPVAGDLMQLSLPTPFEGIYGEASKVQDRIYLIKLAKEYHIRKQNFVEACLYRDIEKRLMAQVEEAVNEIGRDALNQGNDQVELRLPGSAATTTPTNSEALPPTTGSPSSETPRTDTFAQRLTAARVPASKTWPHWYDYAAALEREIAACHKALMAPQKRIEGLKRRR